jgi:hypothetical protein
MFSVLRLPKEKREWLFEDPKEGHRGTRNLLLRLGQLVAILFLVAVSLTPLLEVSVWLAVIGLALYAAASALRSYRFITSGDRPRASPRLKGPTTSPGIPNRWPVLTPARRSHLQWVMDPGPCLPRRWRDLPYPDYRGEDTLPGKVWSAVGGAAEYHAVYAPQIASGLPNNSADPTRLAAQNGHLSCPPGGRRVKAGSPATVGSSPLGRYGHQLRKAR